MLLVRELRSDQHQTTSRVQVMLLRLKVCLKKALQLRARAKGCHIRDVLGEWGTLKVD